ncbi:MAG: sulfurtransferase TusA family protein [Dehalococcoidales bacterium]|nr:sulfurtransferase TusA family protein [Dehalococcoidales bacterium]
MANSQKGLAVVISPDDAFKYASFFLPYLDDEHFRSTARKLDVSDLICPLSKIKAAEFMDSLEKDDQAEIIVGDKDSLKNIAQEAKSRGLKLDFKQANEDKFIIHIIKGK